MTTREAKLARRILKKLLSIEQKLIAVQANLNLSK